MNTSNFQNECLEQHNEYREMHGCKPLKLSSKLNATAQKWADDLVRRNVFEHSHDRNGNGENLYYSWSSAKKIPKGDAAADAWYSEIKDYDWNDSEEQIMKKFGKIGHFTQLVWDQTEQLGVGVATDGKGKWIVVAHYSPGGNMYGSFKKHVPAKK